ncbi:hypothetical protein F3Y22_tig00113123pilonHSYRG00209 [Hibiscus syriacus]|uniref:Reverse transcriptase domain-containing protein n=1 Tax=Hibiscus syriacus TaxID=106335 RepID=A0A6A2XM41_HIBSY|nr:hypothetical protein F3Y22_tig00113123pilonHSYRG00209 [Hibiscus syriacus]
MPRLVRPNQTSSIVGRSVTENIIINQEVVHSMKAFKSSKGWMAIKVDLEKAFERVQWAFIHDTLVVAPFPPNIIRVIMHCITSSFIQVQWNGIWSSSFRPERGIRQGESLSPYLFILVMERLGNCIHNTVSSGAWKPFHLVRNGSAISHLFFAAILFYMEEQIWPKSESWIQFLLNLALFLMVESLGKYLGTPVIHKRLSSSDYEFILDRMRSKLNGWTTCISSMAGRLTFAKSVLAAIPIYFMQTTLLSTHICSEIDKIIRQFLWGSTTSGRKPSLLNWDTVRKLWIEVVLASITPEAIIWRSFSKLLMLWKQSLTSSESDPLLFRICRIPAIGVGRTRGLLRIAAAVRLGSAWHGSARGRVRVNLGGRSAYCNDYTHRDEFVSKAVTIGTCDPLPGRLLGLSKFRNVSGFLFGKLMTQSERAQRHLTPDSYCPVCNSAPETLLHSLRDCAAVRGPWNKLLAPKDTEFFRSQLQPWLQSNLNSTKILSQSGISWNNLFSSLLWLLWKRQNDHVFSASCWPLEDLLHRGIALAKHFTEFSPSKHAQSSDPMERVSWVKPLAQWLCLNTDGAMDVVAGSSSIGGVIRSNNGTWITGFNKHIGISNPFQTELWGVFVGLQVAWSLGNLVAEKMAKLSTPSHPSLILHDQPPHEVTHLLDRDAAGYSYSRKSQL